MPVLLLGDCKEELKILPNNSIDSVVTDPPYGLKFMGKKWDYEVPSVDIWREVIRVLKPGGHLLSFGGTRTYHRLTVAIEDSGFEIRDQIQWLYGSGFPKSHNLEGDHEGWGTALKPANEPIVLARKPLEKGLTVAQNMAKWGVGALNIYGTRIGTNDNLNGGAYSKTDRKNPFFKNLDANAGAYQQPQGRWPANVLLDETAAEMLDEQSVTSKSGGASRFFYIAKASKRERNAGLEGMPKRVRNITEGHGRGAINTSKGDGTGIRENKPCANHHPTVKPIKLMEYLIKLITPPGGIVLDPFMGSGSTGVAAKRLNYEFIGIEMSEEYLKIAEKRIGIN